MKGLLIRVDFKGCAIIGRTCDPELDGFGDVEELWKHWDGPPYVSASALFHCLWFLITTWITTFTTFTTFTTHHPLTTVMTLGNNENFSPWDSRHLGITGPFCRASISPVRPHRGLCETDRMIWSVDPETSRVSKWSGFSMDHVISIDIYRYQLIS